MSMYIYIYVLSNATITIEVGDLATSISIVLEPMRMCLLVFFIY